MKYKCRNAYNTLVSNTVSTDKNPKKLYSFIKSTEMPQQQSFPLKTNDIAYSDPKIKATLLNNQFSSAFTAEYHLCLQSMDRDPYPKMQKFTITGDGVKKLLLNLDPYKATGLHNISPRFLKDFADKITLALVLIFPASLQQGKVPQDKDKPIWFQSSRKVIMAVQPTTGQFPWHLFALRSWKTFCTAKSCNTLGYMASCQTNRMGFKRGDPVKTSSSWPSKTLQRDYRKDNRLIPSSLTSHPSNLQKLPTVFFINVWIISYFYIILNGDCLYYCSLLWRFGEIWIFTNKFPYIPRNIFVAILLCKTVDLTFFSMEQFIENRLLILVCICMEITGLRIF